MREPEALKMSWEEAQGLLGVADNADERAIHDAYIAKVRLHPPDRDPETFEKVRDAYEQLRNPQLRAEQVLHGVGPRLPLSSLLAGRKPQHRYVGPGPWLAVLKERKA